MIKELVKDEALLSKPCEAATADDADGCLTRDEESKVTRFDRIKVAYDELADGALKPRKRDFTGWTAQVIQHMIDHCKGKLV